MYYNENRYTPLDKPAALIALQRLTRLPQTKHVFALIGRHSTFTLVWVRTDGLRRHISTQEQVDHALNG